MSGGRLPDDVDEFIGEHIHSVEQLEVLLLLRRSESESWTAELVARELRIDPASAGTRLQDLATRGLVAAGDFSGRYHYGPASPRLAASVDHLAQTYTDRRVAVITRIFSRPDPAQSFADAFRIKERK